MTSFGAYAQSDTLRLTLDQVIDMASQNSINAFRIKNMYRSSYWSFRYFKASRLPSLTLDATPFDYNHLRSKEYNISTNEDVFVQREYFNSDFSLSLNQAIPLTGGSLFMSSDLGLVKNLGSGSDSYRATPISIGFQQTLNGYNQMKWESKIEPLKYEKAKRQLIESREELSISAVTRFFSLAAAQVRLNIAITNMASADTLYNIGKGRFQIGTVTQDELLKLELNLLEARSTLTSVRSQVTRTMTELCTFLAIDKNTKIECIVPVNIPSLQIDTQEALDKAWENNPIVLDHEQRLLENNQNVARTKSQMGFNTTIYASYGLDQSSEKLKEVYNEPDNSQRFRLGVRIPILDWGQRKGNYQMAKYQRDAQQLVIEQERIEFELGLIQQVIDFNLQSEQVHTAAMADTVARKGYEVTFQRFIIGKVDVINLDQARNNLQNARLSYIQAVQSYWNYYYTLRSQTLFDFATRQTLSAEYDKLLEE
jgi:outer membrane protein TolC